MILVPTHSKIKPVQGIPAYFLIIPINTIILCPHYALPCSVLLFPTSEDQTPSSAHHWQGTVRPDLLMCVMESSCMVNVMSACQPCTVRALGVGSRLRYRWNPIWCKKELHDKNFALPTLAITLRTEGEVMATCITPPSRQATTILQSKSLRSTAMSETLNGKFPLQYQVITCSCFQG